MHVSYMNFHGQFKTIYLWYLVCLIQLMFGIIGNHWIHWIVDSLIFTGTDFRNHWYSTKKQYFIHLSSTTSLWPGFRWLIEWSGP